MFSISVPALIIVGIILMHVGPHTFAGSTLGVDDLSWAAAAGYTIGVAPFMILLSYILRIATLTKRTLTIGPFILQESKTGRYRLVVVTALLVRFRDDRERQVEILPDVQGRRLLGVYDTPTLRTPGVHPDSVSGLILD